MTGQISETNEPGAVPCSAILVKSTSQAIKIERIFESVGLQCRLIPTPREFSSNCGSALRIEGRDAERALELIESAGAGPVEIKQMNGPGPADMPGDDILQRPPSP